MAPKQRPPSPIENFRTEIREYMDACERLLMSQISSSATPFSEDELHLLEYYTQEVRQLLDQSGQQPQH